MFQAAIFLLIVKYWYITIPAAYIICSAIGSGYRQEAEEKVNKALHGRPY